MRLLICDGGSHGLRNAYATSFSPTPIVSPPDRPLKEWECVPAAIVSVCDWVPLATCSVVHFHVPD